MVVFEGHVSRGNCGRFTVAFPDPRTVLLGQDTSTVSGHFAESVAKLHCNLLDLLSLTFKSRSWSSAVSRQASNRSKVARQRMTPDSWRPLASETVAEPHTWTNYLSETTAMSLLQDNRAVIRP